MLKLVWVNPRDRRAELGWDDVERVEGARSRSGRLTMGERLLLAASGAYTVGLIWGM